MTYHTVLACDTQLKMMPFGLDNLVLIDDEVRRKTFEIGQRGGGGVNTAKKEWGIGELEFEALMRMLDNSVRFFRKEFQKIKISFSRVSELVLLMLNPL